MYSHMYISVITVCLNNSDTISTALNSIHSQTYNYVEHIVVDGGSKDGTLEILSSFKPIHMYSIKSEPDNGLYDALNKGINRCTGSIIGILHSDDRFSTTAELEKIAEFFKANPDTDIVFGDIDFVDNHDANRIVRKYRCKSFRKWKLRFGIMPAHTATFVRRSVYEDYGLYKTNFKISADYEKFVFWLHANRLKYKYINRIITKMMHGGVSTSGISNSILLNKEIIRACRSNGLYTNLFLVALKIPFKLLSIQSRKS